MNWEPIKSIRINRKPATLWTATGFRQAYYAVTLDRSEDMIISPRDYEKATTRGAAIMEAKLRYNQLAKETR